MLHCPQKRIDYVALGEEVKEALFTGAVLSFVAQNQADHVSAFFRIVRGVIALAAIHLSSAWSKHIDVHFHFVGELLRAKKIDIQFVASKEQTHQHGSQLSNTPYYADSPKRHVTVIVEKSKRTPFLVLYKAVNTVTGQQFSTP